MCAQKESARTAPATTKHRRSLLVLHDPGALCAPATCGAAVFDNVFDTWRARVEEGDRRTVLGDSRTWFAPIALPRVEEYAQSIGASVHVVSGRTADALANELGLAFELRSSWSRNPLGRRNQTSYGLKLIVAGRALARGHERVLMIDDTVVIRPGAGDIFDACPETAVACGYSEGLAGAAGKKGQRRTLEMSDLFLRQRNVGVHPAEYINTGVVV